MRFEVCSWCNGKGRVRFSQIDPSEEEFCIFCSGTGIEDERDTFHEHETKEETACV